MVYLILIVFGLCLGSFVNALVWRVHEGEELRSQISDLRKRQYLSPQKVQALSSKLQALSILKGRSMCPNCQHELAARDLVPVLSWLGLRGKCRYCQRPISWQYPLVELLTAGLFIASYHFWPMSFGGVSSFLFGAWLIFLVGLVALAVYDLKWFILANRIVYPLIGLALVQVLIVSLWYRCGWADVLGAGWGVLIASGVFYLLFQVSQGQWIGGGDVKLGALLGLLVGGPLMSVLLLFMASVVGTVVAVPLLVTGRATRRSRLPFGPFLIIAVIIVRLFGASLIAWYKQHTGLS